MNYVNYLSHILYEPDYYFRRFDLDLPDLKALSQVGLPLVSLYQPAGWWISLGMGGSRSVTHLVQAGVAGYQGEGWVCAQEMGQTAMAVLAFAGTFFSFQVGLFITTGADLAISVVQLEILQAALSFLYLLILLTGSLEITFLSLVIQGCICIYEAHEEKSWFACFGKAVLSGARFYQAYGKWGDIQQKNALLKFEKYAKLLEKVRRGRETWHLVDSALHDRGQEVMLIDGKGKPVPFGWHTHGYGKELVKGMNLEFREQEGMLELDFKVNHVFRERLDVLMQGLNEFQPDELGAFLRLTQAHARSFTLEKTPFFLGEQEYGTALKMTLEGLGTVMACSSKEFPNLYDRVKVRVAKDATLYQLHELMAFFTLDDALRVSSSADVERLKMGHLFRIFYPREATLFERDARFFTLPVHELRAEIVRRSRGMENVFEEYLSKMQVHEILPGKVRYTIPGLADHARSLGGRALITAITGAHGDEACERTASILKMGLIASEMRYDHRMQEAGLSPSADFHTGGADSVFTQLVTERDLREGVDLDRYYWGDIHLILSLDLIETGTYQYFHDVFGWRKYTVYPEFYLARPDILHMIERSQDSFFWGHEVMIKERVPPSMIQGILVENEEIRQNLLRTLRLRGLISLQETILGIPVDQFVRTNTTV